MAGAIHLASPQVLPGVGLRFLRNDGSTSDVISGNVVEFSTKGQTNTLVVHERKL